MKLMVNGDPMELTEGSKVADLLGQLKLKPELVVVELNLNILKRDELARMVLNEGDQVEIVHFVGGGSRQTGLRGLGGFEGTLQTKCPEDANYS